MNPVDTQILLWLNGFVGTFKPFDDVMRVFASDYLVPMLLSLALLGTWFAGRNAAVRERCQRAAIIGMTALGLSNAVVAGLNFAWYRPRPFVPLGDELTLLFYPPTDPSFPANPAAVGFAVTAALWNVNRKLRWTLFAAASLMAFARLYAGVFYPTDILGGAAVGVLMVLFTKGLRMLVEPVPTLFIRLGRALSLA